MHLNSSSADIIAASARIAHEDPQAAALLMEYANVRKALDSLKPAGYSIGVKPLGWQLGTHVTWSVAEHGEHGPGVDTSALKGAQEILELLLRLHPEQDAKLLKLYVVPDSLIELSVAEGSDGVLAA